MIQKREEHGRVLREEGLWGAVRGPGSLASLRLGLQSACCPVFMSRADTASLRNTCILSHRGSAVGMRDTRRPHPPQGERTEQSGKLSDF